MIGIGSFATSRAPIISVLPGPHRRVISILLQYRGLAGTSPFFSTVQTLLVWPCHSLRTCVARSMVGHVVVPLSLMEKWVMGSATLCQNLGDWSPKICRSDDLNSDQRSQQWPAQLNCSQDRLSQQMAAAARAADNVGEQHKRAILGTAEAAKWQ